MRLQTATTATALPASRVGGNRRNVLNAANAHASTSKSAKSALGARTRGLRADTTRATDADVNSGDANLLAARGTVLRSKHGSVRRGLVTVSLDLHTAGNADDRFLAREIGHMDEGIVEGSVDAGTC